MSKLGTRSAKDVPLYSADFYARTEALFVDELARVPPDARDEAAELRAFIVASTRAMRSQTGAEVLALLTRSERVASDINRVLEYDPRLFRTTIELRAWDDEVVARPEYEFRGFVNARVLNALSSYFTFLHSREIAAQADAIAARVREFHAGVADIVPHESYVIDMWSSPERTVIIELNPFHQKCGPALFSWRDDRERFLNGPFECRITSAERPPTAESPLEMLSRYWQQRIAALRSADSPAAVEAAARERAKGSSTHPDEANSGCALQ